MNRSVAGLAAVLLGAALCCAAPAQSPAVLGISGDAFTIDGARTWLTFISYFDALPRAAATGGVDEDFAYLEGKVQGIRIFANWWGDPCALRSAPDTLIDLEGKIRPASWQALQTVLDGAARHRLIVDLSLTRETVTDNGAPARTLTFEAYADAVSTLVGSPDYLKGRYPHVLVDVQNEWPRFAQPQQIEGLLGRIQAADPDRVLAASSSGGPYQPIGLKVPRMAAAYHDPRDRDWFTPQAAARVVQGVRSALGGTVQPIYLQEPMPASARCRSSDHDQDPSHFVEAARNARAAGAAAWTFHTRLGFNLRERSLTQLLQDPTQAAQRQVLEQLGR